MPGPRAAAVAVMGMLGFGVIVGSLVGGTSIATLASAPLIVVGLGHTTHTVPAMQSAATPQASGGGSGEGAAGGASAGSAQASASASTSPSSASGGGAGTTTTSSSTGYGGLPPVKHVFLIVLSDRGFRKSFGAGASGGYLGGALRQQGELIYNYYAVAGAPLANEIALTSGQGPTAQTASDCPAVSRIKPGRKGPRGQILGAGCVYPTATPTLAGQLSKVGDSWKAYFQGVSTSSAATCKVPKLGSKEPQTANARDSYLTWRNPFVYFRSLTSGTGCAGHEVGLGQLATDLKSASTTPSFLYLVPSPCENGSEAPCEPHTRPGLPGANSFLKTVVPEIKRSAAYKDGGMIAITFDQAPQTGPDADPSACCGPSSYPNLAKLTTPAAVPPAAMGAGGASTTTATAADTTATATITSGTTTTGTTTTDTTTTGTDTTTTGTTTGTTTTGTTTTGTTTTGTTTTSTTTTGADTTTTDTSTTGTTSTTGSTSTTTPTSTTPTGVGGGETTPTGGGGQVGLLLISQYVKPGSSDVIDYFNHFSLLGSIEKLFGLHTLGYAGTSGLSLFGVGVYNNYSG